jgi:hypothetical protein
MTGKCTHLWLGFDKNDIRDVWKKKFCFFFGEMLKNAFNHSVYSSFLNGE